MTGLTERDMRVLGYYASTGNRELYWNYLAHLPGNDGYGLLALGVVRNDNTPGAVANIFAANHAREQDNRTLSEREWERFGQDLIARDIEERRQYQERNSELALNLPVEAVQRAHDASFGAFGIDPNAWTPRELLEAARRHGGEGEAEKVWAQMLDNDWLGLPRGRDTLASMNRYNDEQFEAGSYFMRVSLARVTAAVSRPNTDPDVIGSNNAYFVYDRARRGWSEVAETPNGPYIQPVRDAKTLAGLDDARDVRLERLHKRDQFHPDDPYRTILRSPATLADESEARPALAERAAPLERASPAASSPAAHPLHGQVLKAVHRLDESLGRSSDAGSERLAASLTLLAASSGLSRVDHVVLSANTGQTASGEHVFVVQGGLEDPAHLTAHMKTQTALDTPVERSLQLLDALEPVNAQTQALSENRAPATAMSLG